MQNLIVDARQSKALISSLQSSPGAEVAELDTGDYAWLSDTSLTIGIEAKTSTDLIGSFTSGRLGDQISRLVACYDVPILLVFGSVGRIGNTIYAQRDLDAPTKVQQASQSCLLMEHKYMPINSPWAGLGNFLMSAQAAGLLLDWNNCTLPRLDVEPQRVRELIAYWDKPEHTSLNRRRYYNPYATEPKAQAVLVLCAFPGISDALATRIIEHFGNIAAVAEATIEQLAMVPGIGHTRASSIYNLVRAGCTGSSA